MMKALNTLFLGLVFTLSPDAGQGHLVKDVTEFLDQKIDFVGHDNGFRAHITALERDFQELNNLENEVLVEFGSREFHQQCRCSCPAAPQDELQPSHPWRSELIQDKRSSPSCYHPPRP